MFGPTRPSVKSYLRLTESFQFSSVQSLSHVWLFANPWTAARQASLSITNTQSLLKLMSTKPVMPSNHLHPLLAPSPPAFNLSQHQGLFPCVGFLHQVAKVLELQLQHQSFQWIFRIDFLTNLDSILKIRAITVLTKVRIVKAIVSPLVIYRCESWTLKKVECWRMMLSNCGAGEDSWEPFGQEGGQTSQS